jgi:type IV pilus assembly protein PilM
VGLSGQGIRNYLNDLPDQLGLSPKKMIGIDVGHSSIKAVEITYPKNGPIKIHSMIYLPISEGILLDDEVQRRDDFKTIILELLKQSGSKIKNISIALGGSGTVSKKLQLAGGSLEEIDDQVQWEADQYLPFPIDDCYLSYHILGENAGGGAEVFVAAAKKDLVDFYKEFFIDLNLKLKNVELKSTALANFSEYYLRQKKIDNSKSIMVLDIGANKTTLVILKNYIPIFHKEIYLGGASVTAEIQREFLMSFDEAENLKIVRDGQGNLPEEVLDVVNRMINNITNEIKKAYEFYLNTSSDDSLYYSFVTGGGSLTPGILELISQIFSIPVEHFEADSLFALPKGSQQRPDELILFFPTAIALAMKGENR